MHSSATVADMWLMSNAECFKPEHLPSIKTQLAQLPEERMDILYSVDIKNPTTMLLISIFLGEFGVDRFMVGDTLLGILKLITLGGCFIWWIIDIFLIMDRTRDRNYEKFMQVFGYYR